MGHAGYMNARRFPPPWSIEEHPESFAILDATGQALAYVYMNAVLVVVSPRSTCRLTNWSRSVDRCWQVSPSNEKTPDILAIGAAAVGLFKLPEWHLARCP
jgi:hypothetical protein